MPSRLPNPRLAKVHRSYTVEEVARLYRVHRNTVRQWIKSGLPTCDDQRPLLILGRDLGLFLTTRRHQQKRPCSPGQIFCVRCREPQTPALNMADFEPLTASTGNLIGLCPRHGSLMYRRVRTAALASVSGELSVKLTNGQSRIDESCKPSVNRDFEPGD